MEIILHDGKREVLLRSGAHSFELCERKVRKGGVTWEPIKWYVSLPAAFEALLRRKVRNSDARTLLELKDAILRGQADLMEVWTLDRFSAVAQSQGANHGK